MAGIGYDILVDILKYICPSHVVKIRISAETKNLPAGAFWLDEEECCTATLVEINSARQDSFNRSYVPCCSIFYTCTLMHPSVCILLFLTKNLYSYFLLAIKES